MKKKIAIAVTVACAGVMDAMALSPYIARVLEYKPAPGQFVNNMPIYETGMTEAEVLDEVAANIAGASTGDARPGMITLGAYGGYVTFAFDHPVVNVRGEYDFKIYGNAIAAADHEEGGSAEPGIVMVSVDTNGNGQPDDEWFELAGSEYASPDTRRGYTITYYRPATDHVAVPDPDDMSIIDRQYIRWTSNDPDAPEGWITRNAMNARNSYWPEWDSRETMTFSGSRLKANAMFEDGMYILPFFDWGYADNRPNDSDPGFNIDNAVDADGKKVSLDKIDYVRVYTAQNQSCGMLGETSTEITGGEDLHPEAVAGIATVGRDDAFSVIGCDNGCVTIVCAEPTEVSVYSLDGRLWQTASLPQGRSVMDMMSVPAGVYIMRTAYGTCVKIMR